MKIYIVRHADKEVGEYYNRHLKHQDSPISEKGIQRSKNLVDYFQAKEIKKIIVSEYLRTTQTARYVAEYKDIQIVRDKRLNEIDNGVLEQMDDAQIKEKYPTFWNDFFSYSKDVRFPEGETGEEVKNRQKDLLHELIFHDEDVLLISHEGFIRLLLCHLLDIPVYERRKFEVDFCGVTELEFMKETKEWKIIRINQLL